MRWLVSCAAMTIGFDAASRSASARSTRRIWGPSCSATGPRWPTLRRSWLAELEAAGIEAACIEAIKLLESPLHDRCDEIWVVRCEESDAISRLASRGIDEATARARLANQSPQAEKIAAADVVIDGSAAPDETRRQVNAALDALLARPA